MSQVKGGTLKSRIEFIKEHYGQDGLEKVLSKVTEEDRDILTGILLYSSWYPYETYDRLDKAIREVLAPADKHIYKKMGAFSAKQHLNSIYQAYLKQNDPLAFCKIFPNIFKAYYDSGRVEPEFASEHSVIFKIYDFASPTRPDCESNVGYIEEGLNLCGAKNPKVVETKCRLRGSEYCEIIASWEPDEKNQ